MKFGVREICNVTLRAKAPIKLGKKQYFKDEPVFYFDSLKTSTLEGASTTVYAQGGRGNARLVAWEGDRTITFTMEDALATPETASLLVGSTLSEGEEYIHAQLELHKEIKCYVGSKINSAKNTHALLFFNKEELKNKIPELNNDEFLNMYVYIGEEKEPYIITESEAIDDDEREALNTSKAEQSIVLWKDSTQQYTLKITKENTATSGDAVYDKVTSTIIQKATKVASATSYNTPSNYIKGITDFDGLSMNELQEKLKTVYFLGGTYPATVEVDKETFSSENKTAVAYVNYIDYYYKANCKTINIESEISNYNYYLEAETLFRDAATGLDYPAHFILPNCRLQPNFTFNMANSGDPGTFTFTIDAFPGYVKGGSGNKVLAVIQILDEPETDVDLAKTRTLTPEPTT